MSEKALAIVSGLSRCGISTMTKMLEAGAMHILTGRPRAADDDNPRGCSGFGRVMQIEQDRAWLSED